MAHAHQNAAAHHHRGRGETILFRSQQGSNDDISARLHLPIHLEGHSTPEVVGHESLLGLRQTDFPGGAGVFE